MDYEPRTPLRTAQAVVVCIINNSKLAQTINNGLYKFMLRNLAIDTGCFAISSAR